MKYLQSEHWLYLQCNFDVAKSSTGKFYQWSINLSNKTQLWGGIHIICYNADWISNVCLNLKQLYSNSNVCGCCICCDRSTLTLPTRLHASRRRKFRFVIENNFHWNVSMRSPARETWKHFRAPSLTWELVVRCLWW